jgi:hypothetical protein
MSLGQNHEDLNQPEAHIVRNADGELQVPPVSQNQGSLLQLVPELAPYPRLLAVIERAWTASERRLRVVFSDLEDTLVLGQNHALAARQHNQGVVQKLLERMQERGEALVVITGSAWDVDTATTPSVKKRIANGEVPNCDALVTSGGETAIGTSDQGEKVVDAQYQQWVSTVSASFHAENVFGVARFIANNINQGRGTPGPALSAIDFSKVHEIQPQSPRERIYFQPHVHPEGESPFARVSLYFFANTVAERDQVEYAFRGEFPNLTVVCCEEKDYSAEVQARELLEHPMKYCLDITPTHKGLPVDYFMRAIQKAADALHARDGGSELTVDAWYCGDAANDLVAARRPEIKTVVMVGGASQEFLRHQHGLLGEDKRVYVDSDSSSKAAESIFRALNAADASGG